MCDTFSSSKYSNENVQFSSFLKILAGFLVKLQPLCNKCDFHKRVASDLTVYNCINIENVISLQNQLDNIMDYIRNLLLIVNYEYNPCIIDFALLYLI